MVEIPASRYDLSTYQGRVKHFISACSPLTLFHSNNEIKYAQKLVADYANGSKPLDDQFWKAKQLVDSSVHPDTNEIITLPFRMSCNVISNLAICAGMLNPNLSTSGTIFWQWANQSLNVAVNYANANKSAPISTSELLKSYGIAVASSVSIAVGLQPMVRKLKVSPGTKMVLTRLIPFAAVVSAGLVNVGVMRSQEIIKGISVFDNETNKEVGTSRYAAIRAVGETAASRAINATPIMVVPPLVLLKLQKSGFLSGRSKLFLNAVNLGVIAITSFSVLPFALAVFPQKTIISGDHLEPEFKGKTVWFNRGV